jgi:acyl-[acyl-carrier-protein]-phospholipid O-acyltransferase/long-chain-fatty-acid--[acyl-carrier-protein] ligase
MAPSDKTHSYRELLASRSFRNYLWAQALGSFNDNLLRVTVSLTAMQIADTALAARYLALAGAAFVIPFLVFGGWAGQIADRYRKSAVMQVTKFAELAVVLLSLAALASGNMNFLLSVLFLLAMQANLFSPAKYGSIPEMVNEQQISRANGLVEFSTYGAIVLGTAIGSVLFGLGRHSLLFLGIMLVAIALAGVITAKCIGPTRAPAVPPKFRWNPVAEVIAGTRRLLLSRTQTLTVLGISGFYLLGALFQLTILLFGKEALALSELQTGLLITVLAVGIGLGSLAAGWISGNGIETGLIPFGAMGVGISFLALASAHNFISAVVSSSAAGFASGLLIVPLNALLQESASPHEKGRIQSANNFWNAVGIILASGMFYLMHDLLHFSAARIVLFAGIADLFATVIAAWLLPAAIVRLALLALTRAGFRIQITGSENLPTSGGALIVSNHASYADALLIAGATSRQVRFLMWEPLCRKPWLRPVCQLFRTIPLPERAPKESLRALRTARQELEAGGLICIFPEGAIASSPHVQPFQRGVEYLMRGEQTVPVIPVYLEGLWGHPLSRAPHRAKGLRAWFRRPVTISIGKPVVNFADAGALHHAVVELAATLEPATAETLASRFVRNARRGWSRPCFDDSLGRNFTYGRALTAALLLRGIVTERAGESEHIGILLPSSTGAALANLAVTLAGKSAVNLNFTAGADSLNHAVVRCDLRLVISSRAFREKLNLPVLAGTIDLEDTLPLFSRLEKLSAFLAARLLPVRRLLPRIAPGDTAAVIFSSGSTGTPKGVVLSHRNLLSNLAATAQIFSVDSGHCMLGVLPFFHSFGYAYTFWFPLLNGFRTIYHQNPTDARTIGELAAAHRVTMFLSTPTFCLGYLRRCQPDQFRSLRYLLVGAERLRPELADAFEERFGVRPLEGYGCTEMSPVIAVNSPAELESTARPGSVGRPLPNISLRIVDPETGQEVPQGESGLLLVKGPARMRGYLDDATRTAESLRDGYYVTGDIARVDAEGYLYIVDRITRFSKIGGEMVPHVAIEEAIASMPGSGRCLVTATPDPSRGERLAVLYTGEASADELTDHLDRKRIPALWIPRRNHFIRVPELPTLGTGKVDLRAARALALRVFGEAA